MAHKKKSSVKLTSRFTEWMRSQRGRHTRGVIYILFSFFMAVAMLSFFLNPADVDANWLGIVGHGLSSFLAKTFFGIASFGFPLILFVLGCRVLGKPVLPFAKTFWVTLFWMVWLSTFLGYVVGIWNDDSERSVLFEDFAGLGLPMAESLHTLLGWFSIVFLLLVAGIFLVYVHHLRLHLPKVALPLSEADDSTTDDVERSNGTVSAVAKKDVSAAVVETPKSPDDDNAAVISDDVVVRHSPADSDSSAQNSSIDDEFERVMQRARGDNPAPADDTPDAPVDNGDVAFTINDSDVLDTQSSPSSANATPPAADEDQPPSSPAADDGFSDLIEHHGLDELYDPHLDLRDFQMPSTDLLQDWEQRNVKVTVDELKANKDRIVKTLSDYGIEIVGISASPGPTVTLYEIKPAAGVRISKIKGLEDDIALSLSALGIRIIAPIPGKGTVGIEVPNAKPQVVSMKTMLESDAFVHADKMELPIAIGKTISNEAYVTDLTKMPHLLMAGATGTGKSVGLNAVITSLLYKKHPSELKFVMVDPKKVELSLYNKIERHYLAKLPDVDEAIITDVKLVVRTLNSLCIEMDQRYDLLKMAQVRKITEYNDKFVHRHLNPENGHHYMPYIVVVIDEFADLIMTAGKEVEAPICRLAQLARAVGIHLIIATQRPTTNIITGTIKANFPARIAFKVTSSIDSRTILDAAGAQRLIGRGDMLISLSGADMIRLQCALIETEEIDKLADSIGLQRGYPDGFLLPEYLDENDEPNKEFDPSHKDEFFNDAARLVLASQFGSTSLIQRKLKLGFNRAGRIIDQLEAAGIVGPYNGAKPREVLVHDEATLEDILSNL